MEQKPPQKFDFDEFLEFVDTELKKLAIRDGIPEDGNGRALKNERIFACMTKVTEELGEFASEIFISLGKTRKEKLRENSAELAKEFADVVITLVATAREIGIDIKSALQTKMEIIKNRKY
jgi:NTP pyrophosphatase (non-canonical NTP hydrolase)